MTIGIIIMFVGSLLFVTGWFWVLGLIKSASKGNNVIASGLKFVGVIVFAIGLFIVLYNN